MNHQRTPCRERDLAYSRELTALKRWTTQCWALAAMGIAFLPNAVGRRLVERSAVLSQPAKKPQTRAVLGFNSWEGHRILISPETVPLP